MSHRYSSMKKASLLVLAAAVFSFGLVGLSTEQELFPEVLQTAPAAADDRSVTETRYAPGQPETYLISLAVTETRYAAGPPETYLISAARTETRYAPGPPETYLISAARTETRYAPGQPETYLISPARTETRYAPGPPETYLISPAVTETRYAPGPPETYLISPARTETRVQQTPWGPREYTVTIPAVYGSRPTQLPYTHTISPAVYGARPTQLPYTHTIPAVYGSRPTQVPYTHTIPAVYGSRPTQVPYTHTIPAVYGSRPTQVPYTHTISPAVYGSRPTQVPYTVTIPVEHTHCSDGTTVAAGQQCPTTDTTTTTTTTLPTSTTVPVSTDCAEVQNSHGPGEYECTYDAGTHLITTVYEANCQDENEETCATTTVVCTDTNLDATCDPPGGGVDWTEREDERETTPAPAVTTVTVAACTGVSHSHGIGEHPSGEDNNSCHSHSCGHRSISPGHGGGPQAAVCDTGDGDDSEDTPPQQDPPQQDPPPQDPDCPPNDDGCNENPPQQDPVQTPTTPTTTTPTTTTPTTTTTTPTQHVCIGGQHRDGGSGNCHPHPVPTTCGTAYQAINASVHSTETTPACPTGRWVDTCPAPASGMHGHTFWQPTSLPWPADAQPYGSHGCADHTPPACANTGPTDYWVSDTSIFSEYTWQSDGPRPTEMMTRLRAGEIFFHAAATVPQCQPENTCPSNTARGHVPASLTDTSYSGHGCDPHPVPACPKYGDTAPTYYVHDPAGSDTWPGHRLVTLDTHHNNGDTHCHTVPQCVPESVVAEAAANTNPKPLQDYDGPDGVPPREYWHFGPTWGSLAGSWLHYGDGIYTGTYIPECPPAPPPPGPGTVTVTVTAPYRLVHGGLLHPETFTATVTGFGCTGFCGDGTGPVARIETVDFGLTLTATNGYLREPDQASRGTGQYAVKQCVPTPTDTTLAPECTAAAPNDVTTTDRVVAVVGLFYNATNEESTVAGSQRVHPQITGFAGTYRYWFTQNGAVTSATAPLTVTVVSTAGTDGQKVWSSLINPDN